MERLEGRLPTHNGCPVQARKTAPLRLLAVERRGNVSAGLIVHHLNVGLVDAHLHPVADPQHRSLRYRDEGRIVGAAGKTVVFGMLERGGAVMAKVVPNVSKPTLYPIITENIEPGSTIHTAEFGTYRGQDRAGYKHEAVSRKTGEYARGESHVNAVEGFWSRLKSSIRGTHVHLSGQHLQKYVKEFEFRYNRRKRPGTMFGDLVARF